MTTPSVQQARLLSVAADGATLREPLAGGEWSYSYPGQSRQHQALAVTCRSLLKHGWIERSTQQSATYAVHYVISAEGRAVLGVAPVSSGPANIKF